MSSIIINDFLRKLNFTEAQTSEIQNRAESYLDTVQYKLTGRNKHGINTRPAVCIHLACKSLGIYVSSKSIIAFSGTTAAKYDLALKELAQLLNVQTKITLEELAVQFGCPQIQSRARAIRQEFTEKFSQHQKGDTCIDPNSTVVLVAIFACAAKTMKIKIDLKKLISSYVNYPKEFRFLQEFIEEVCQQTIDPLPKRSSESLGAKRPSQAESTKPIEGGSAQTQASKKIKLVSPYAGYSMLPFQHLEQTRAYLDYLNWKAAVLKNVNRSFIS
ncbi:Origin of replication complex subunit 6 [Entomophthora muscae]|uniref:Origin of replication complex subunit 6 n=1 Tax=Entomophthora muscae TaxID=34485 RepID=A0ACC2TGM8_9FUNG|nr:Origin of replication complex subunit 6 [Entomophthora muscae]